MEYNFRLFQIESICKQQDKSDSINRKLFQKSRNIVRKEQNTSYQDFLLFPAYFPKAFFLNLKDGHLDFSRLTEFKNLYITEYIYISLSLSLNLYITEKQYKSSIIKNHEITDKRFFDGVPCKGYVAF